MRWQTRTRAAAPRSASRSTSRRAAAALALFLLDEQPAALLVQPTGALTVTC